MAMRTMDFQDTNMNGIDDRDEQNFSGPSQEYLDQLERTRQALNPGQANVNQPTGPNMYGAGQGPTYSTDRFGMPVITQPGFGTSGSNQTFNQGIGALPNQLQPVLQNQRLVEDISDPRLASLFFGTAQTPGFFDQVQAAGRLALSQDIPLRRTAGLSPLELAAIQSSFQGIGGFRPFLQAQQDALLEGVQAERRGGEILQPYFAQAEGQLGQGLQSLIGSVGAQGPSARDLQRASLVGFDPRSAQAFFNPFEQQVVQRTIEDTLQAGEMQDIAQRARDIAQGGESAFGSRARLSAAERRRSLGRGLGEALAGIRSAGFSDALRQAQQESQFQRDALSRAAGFERGLGQDLLSARRGFAGDLLGIGTQRSDLARDIGRGIVGLGQQFGSLGRTQQDLAQRERAELAQLGAVPRQLLETQFGREFQRDLARQSRPLDVLTGIGNLLPRFDPSRSRIESDFGMPIDPTLAGLQAGVGAYRGLAGIQNQAFAGYQNQN
jgi:hypothetical protein